MPRKRKKTLPSHGPTSSFQSGCHFTSTPHQSLRQNHLPWLLIVSISVFSARLPNHQPVVQLDILLGNQIRSCHTANFLPEQKSCCARLFGRSKDAKKGIHQFYLPLWWKAHLGFLFIWWSLLLLQENYMSSCTTEYLSDCHVTPLGSFRSSTCVTGSFQLAWLYNQVTVRPSGCTTG